MLLYDIDDLQSVVGSNLQRRKQEADKVRAIVEEEIAGFQSWLNSLNVVPTIVALRQHFHGIAEEELSRARLTELSEDQRARVAGLLRLCVNKLLHAPQAQLKEMADSGEGPVFVDSLVRLFGLEVVGNQAEESEGKQQKVKRTGS